MMTTDIIEIGSYEVHPANGAFAVVHNGQVRCSFATQKEAVKEATRLDAEESDESDDE